MEPAMVVCTAVAGVGLGGWLAWEIPHLVRAFPGRLEAMAVSVVPHRAIATLVLAVLGMWAAPRPQEASRRAVAAVGPSFRSADTLTGVHWGS